MDEEVRAETRSLVEDRPEIRDGLKKILELDSDGTWSFQDISIDSGAFGEVVSRGIVEQTGDGYRLASPEAVESALDSSSLAVTEKDRQASADTGWELTWPSVSAIDERRIGLLGVALIAVVLVRTIFSYPAVFKPDAVVLAGNDPYMYHEAVEMILADGLPSFSIGGLSELSIDFLSSEIRTHDSLLIVSVWWISVALGGSAETVAMVLAWYPVFAALVTAIAVYAMTMRLTGDLRSSLAAVFFLAIIPAHAYRTSIGFGDHHAMDFLWLSVTAVSLIVVSTQRLEREEPWFGLGPSSLFAIVIGGISVAAQVIAWRGGPLLVLPIAFYAVPRTFFDVESDTSPIRTTAPLLALLVIGAAITLGVHVVLGWLEPYRAAALPLLLVGTTGVTAIAAAIRYFELPAKSIFIVEIVLGAVGGLVAVVALPSVVDALSQFGTYLQQYGGSGIAETHSLFSAELGSIVAPVLLFGFTFFIGVAYLVWATWRQVYHEKSVKWLVVVTYTWWFLLLALIQNRFSGELSLFIAIFTGLGFVHIAAWISLTDTPSFFTADRSTTERRSQSETTQALRQVDLQTVGYIFVLFVLIGGLAGVQSVVKIEQIATSDADYETGVWLEQYTEKQGMAYPDNYVLSNWGNNRADNYLVNGETESYEYAKRHYATFITSNSSSRWYEQFSSDDVGFVFLRPDRQVSPESMYARLQDHYGSQTDAGEALSHYRAIYERQGRVVFEVVPGGTIVGSATPGTNVTATTMVTLPPQNESITYRTIASANSSGTFTQTVPYPGTYKIGNRSVTVSESAVLEGETVTLD